MEYLKVAQDLEMYGTGYYSIQVCDLKEGEQLLYIIIFNNLQPQSVTIIFSEDEKFFYIYVFMFMKILKFNKKSGLVF